MLIVRDGVPGSSASSGTQSSRPCPSHLKLRGFPGTTENVVVAIMSAPAIGSGGRGTFRVTELHALARILYIFEHYNYALQIFNV